MSLQKLINLAKESKVDITICSNGGITLFDEFTEYQVHISSPNLEEIECYLSLRAKVLKLAQKLGQWQ